MIKTTVKNYRFTAVLRNEIRNSILSPTACNVYAYSNKYEYVSEIIYEYCYNHNEQIVTSSLVLLLFRDVFQSRTMHAYYFK